MAINWSKKAIEDATEAYRKGVGFGMSVRIEKALEAAAKVQDFGESKSGREADLEKIVKLIAELPTSTEPPPADILFRSTILSLKHLGITIAKRDAVILASRKLLEEQ